MVHPRRKSPLLKTLGSLMALAFCTAMLASPPQDQLHPLLVSKLYSEVRISLDFLRRVFKIIPPHDPDPVSSVSEANKRIRKGYETYSLFLAPNPYTADSDQQRFLEQKFRDFGVAIGGRNLAVWFYDDLLSERGGAKQRIWSTSFLLGRGYATIFHLDTVGGRYLVILDKHPSEYTYPDNFIALSFRGMSVDNVGNFLGDIERELRSKPSPRKLRLLEIYHRIDSAAERFWDKYKEILLFLGGAAVRAGPK